jgi:hypothetical protein
MSWVIKKKKLHFKQQPIPHIVTTTLLELRAYSTAMSITSFIAGPGDVYLAT